MCYKAASESEFSERALNDPAAALSVVLPLDLPWAGLALVLTVAIAYRLADLGRWRRFGRPGNLGAGALIGGSAALALLPLFLALPERTPLAAAAAFEAALLPPLVALAADAAFGLAATVTTTLAILVFSLGAAWPAALLLLFLLGTGIALIRARLEPLASWLGWTWAKPRDEAAPQSIEVATGDWRRSAIGLVPALLLLPALGTSAPAGVIVILAAAVLHVPALWAIHRLVLGEWPGGAPLPSGLIAGATEDRVSITPLLARIIAELPEGIAVFDGNDRLLACNGQYRALNRDLAADLEPGVGYVDLLRAEIERHGDVDGAAALEAALDRHRSLPWRLEQARGDRGWVQILEQRVADGGTLRVMRDITAIKHRELQFAELAQRNAVLASTVASVTSGIVICDATQPDQPIVFANAAFTRMTGYTTAEAMGRNCRFLQGRDTDREAVERMRRAIAVGRAVTVTVRNYRKDGRTFWNEVNISPLNDENGRLIHFVGILQDVTNRIRTEESLRDAKNQAEMANRAKSEFVANVSHELRTPLNAILGFSEMMQLEFFGPLGAPQYTDYAKDVHKSGKLLLDIINDILDFSKIEAGRMELFPEPVPATEAVSDSLRLVTGRAEAAGVALVRDLPADLPPILVDPRAIRQVLNNLLTNAVKFTPKGGRVTVSARPADGEMVELAVSDTGIGIAAKDIVKVLEPFGQADNSQSRRQQGTGLGLPIAKAQIELSGGTFRLESEPGRGTTVSIRLPVAPERRATPR